MCRSGRHPLLITVCLALLLASCAPATGTPIERRIGRVERGLLADQGDPPWRRLVLADRMAHYHVPGVSIAVVNDFEIEWARGYGVLAVGGDEPVTPDTLFQAASIGKTVVAVAALHVVEEGLLDLDQDVNERLVSWHVPENELTAHEKVTLRRLLSHSAGTNGFGYQGYAQGKTLPTLQQVLDGEYPANSPPVRVVSVPGTGYAYSNGGFVIVQQLLMDVTGRPFAQIAAENVLDPAGMTQSTFEVPLPSHLAGVAARGHWPDGQAIAGGWHSYPEMGTGASLWTTPSDLARFGIEMMRAYAGKPNRLLSPDIAQEVLTRQTPDGAGYGLGFGLSEEGSRRFHFGHDGGNEGFRGRFVMYPELGRGAVIMTSGHVGEGLWREILNGISVEYDLVSDYTVEYTLAALGLLAVAVAAMIWWRRRRRSA
ncbi:MAG: serine hydrolase domain-containing protein [Planctomycetota bacterium]|jgi:CubicO group peptidase (beta-lactamase class C family)